MIRRNPTIFTKLYQLEYHLEKLVRGYPHYANVLLAVQTFPGQFHKDEFVSLLRATICPEGKARSTLEQSLISPRIKDEYHLGIVKKCQKLIKDILYYFIRQHVVDRQKLSAAFTDFFYFLDETVDRIYKQIPTNQPGSHLQHLENVLTISKTIDPYKLDLVNLNTYLDSFRVDTKFPMNLIASMAVTVSVANMSETITTYIEMSDRVCKLLNPFKDVTIYNYKDLHNLNHIFSGKTKDGEESLFF